MSPCEDFTPDFYLTVGDRQPAISATLLDGNGAAVNLAGATVTFSMSSRNESTTGLGGHASIVGDPSLGTVLYAWGVVDTATAGDYVAEWIVAFSDGTQMTFPSDNPIGISVRARV